MSTVRLDVDSQLPIPAAVLRELGIGPGDELALHVEGDRVVLRKSAVSALEALAACSGGLWSGAADEIQRMRDEWER